MLLIKVVKVLKIQIESLMVKQLSKSKFLIYSTFFFLTYFPGVSVQKDNIRNYKSIIKIYIAYKVRK